MTCLIRTGNVDWCFTAKGDGILYFCSFNLFFFILCKNLIPCFDVTIQFVDHVLFNQDIIIVRLNNLIAHGVAFGVVAHEFIRLRLFIPLDIIRAKIFIVSGMGAPIDMLLLSICQLLGFFLRAGEKQSVALL